MKKTKKITISALILFAMLLSIFSSSIAFAVDVRTTPEEHTGHNFKEEYWAIKYDVVGRIRTEDYTPGEFADEYRDPALGIERRQKAEFYAAYINTGSVQTIYMALMNYSRDTRFKNSQGTAPFQVLLQHFRAPGGKHVLIQNSFAGLIAYQENGTNINGVPDFDDELYYGYTLNSEYHKQLINSFLTSEIGHSPFNADLIPQVTPIDLTKTEDGNIVKYEFGMNYENLFVVWQDIQESDNLNETESSSVLFEHIVAISALQSINFTYVLTAQKVENDLTNVTVTTEYDIGKTTDLWIKGDTESNTTTMGGHWWDFGSLSMARYNSTQSITDRLNGSETLGVPGFGLAVSNFARVAIIAAEVDEDQDLEIVDENEGELDGDTSNNNVTKVGIRAFNRDAFLIDFASKPNYTLNEGPEMEAPVKLYPTLQVNNPILGALDRLAVGYIGRFMKPMVESRVNNFRDKIGVDPENIQINVDKYHLFYTICFPDWAGGQINQDPIFVAFAEKLPFSQEGRRIDGFSVLAMIMISALSAIVGFRKLKKRF